MRLNFDPVWLARGGVYIQVALILCQLPPLTPRCSDCSLRAKDLESTWRHSLSGAGKVCVSSLMNGFGRFAGPMLTCV